MTAREVVLAAFAAALAFGLAKPLSETLLAQFKEISLGAVLGVYFRLHGWNVVDHMSRFGARCAGEPLVNWPSCRKGCEACAYLGCSPSTESCSTCRTYGVGAVALGFQPGPPPVPPSPPDEPPAGGAAIGGAA